MKCNINSDKFVIYSSIPYSYNNVVSHYEQLTDLHYADGWRDVVTPSITEHQYFGKVYFDEDKDVVTYEVLDMTEEEIKLNQIL